MLRTQNHKPEPINTVENFESRLDLVSCLSAACSSMCIPYFFEYDWIRLRHGSGAASHPSSHAIGGLVHRGERRTAKEVMDKRRCKSVTSADGILDVN